MKKDKKAALVAAGLLIISIIIAVAIFLQDKSEPENSYTPSQTITVSPDVSKQPQDTDTKIYGLDKRLLQSNNPQTIMIEQKEIEKILPEMTDYEYAYIYFPDTDIAGYSQNTLYLDTKAFHEKNNHIASILLVSSQNTIYTYLLADKDGSVYLKETKSETIEPDSSFKITNRENPITKEQADNPGELIQLIDSGYVRDNRTDLYILSHVKTAFEQLIDYSIQSDPYLYLYVTSAYRSYDEQKQNFDYWVDKRTKELNMSYSEAYEYTAGRVAIPGCSEHHNGLTLDVLTYGYMLDESSQDAPYASWLKHNSYKFGFTIRYEQGKEKYTLITLFEPWHIRYVGKPTAYYLYDNDLCMEEFYHFLLTEKVLEFEHEDDRYMFIYAYGNDISFDDEICEVINFSQIASGVDGSMILVKLTN